jgi:hypothetical protein
VPFTNTTTVSPEEKRRRCHGHRGWPGRIVSLRGRLLCARHATPEKETVSAVDGGADELRVLDDLDAEPSQAGLLASGGAVEITAGHAVPSCAEGILARRRRGVRAAQSRWTCLGGCAGRGDEELVAHRTPNPAARHNKLLVRQGKLGGDAVTWVHFIATTGVVPADQREPGLGIGPPIDSQHDSLSFTYRPNPPLRMVFFG